MTSFKDLYGFNPLETTPLSVDDLDGGQERLENMRRFSGTPTGEPGMVKAPALLGGGVVRAMPEIGRPAVEYEAEAQHFDALALGAEQQGDKDSAAFYAKQAKSSRDRSGSVMNQVSETFQHLSPLSPDSPWARSSMAGMDEEQRELSKKIRGVGTAPLAGLVGVDSKEDAGLSGGAWGAVYDIAHGYGAMSRFGAFGSAGVGAAEKIAKVTSEGSKLATFATGLARSPLSMAAMETVYSSTLGDGRMEDFGANAATFYALHYAVPYANSMALWGKKYPGLLASLTRGAIAESVKGVALTAAGTGYRAATVAAGQAGVPGAGAMGYQPGMQMPTATEFSKQAGTAAVHFIVWSALPGMGGLTSRDPVKQSPKYNPFAALEWGNRAAYRAMKAQGLKSAENPNGLTPEEVQAATARMASGLRMNREGMARVLDEKARDKVVSREAIQEWMNEAKTAQENTDDLLAGKRMRHEEDTLDKVGTSRSVSAFEELVAGAANEDTEPTISDPEMAASVRPDAPATKGKPLQVDRVKATLKPVNPTRFRNVLGNNNGLAESRIAAVDETVRAGWADLVEKGLADGSVVELYDQENGEKIYALKGNQMLPKTVRPEKPTIPATTESTPSASKRDAEVDRETVEVVNVATGERKVKQGMSPSVAVASEAAAESGKEMAGIGVEVDPENNVVRSGDFVARVVEDGSAVEKAAMQAKVMVGKKASTITLPSMEESRLFRLGQALSNRKGLSDSLVAEVRRDFYPSGTEAEAATLAAEYYRAVTSAAKGGATDSIPTVRESVPRYEADRIARDTATHDRVIDATTAKIVAENPGVDPDKVRADVKRSVKRSLAGTEVMPDSTRRDMKEQLRQAFAGMRVVSDGDADAIRNEQVDAAWALIEASSLNLGLRPEEMFAAFEAVQDVSKLKLKRGQEALREGRGLTTFLKDGRGLVRALKSPDISTVIHEISHVFFEFLPATEKAEIAKAYKVGKKGWETSHLEAWAHDTEGYFAHGKAPEGATEKIKAVYERFGDWLTDIYRGMMNTPLERTIDPRVKTVLDRLYVEGFGSKADAEDMPETVKVRPSSPIAAKTGMDYVIARHDQILGIDTETALKDRDKVGMIPRPVRVIDDREGVKDADREWGGKEFWLAEVPSVSASGEPVRRFVFGDTEQEVTTKVYGSQARDNAKARPGGALGAERARVNRLIAASGGAENLRRRESNAIPSGRDFAWQSSSELTEFIGSMIDGEEAKWEADPTFKGFRSVFATMQQRLDQVKTGKRVNDGTVDTFDRAAEDVRTVFAWYLADAYERVLDGVDHPTNSRTLNYWRPKTDVATGDAFGLTPEQRTFLKDIFDKARGNHDSAREGHLKTRPTDADLREIERESNGKAEDDDIAAVDPLEAAYRRVEREAAVKGEGTIKEALEIARDMGIFDDLSMADLADMGYDRADRYLADESRDPLGQFRLINRKKDKGPVLNEKAMEDNWKRNQYQRDPGFLRTLAEKAKWLKARFYLNEKDPMQADSNRLVIEFRSNRDKADYLAQQAVLRIYRPVIGGKEVTTSHAHHEAFGKYVWLEDMLKWEPGMDNLIINEKLPESVRDKRKLQAAFDDLNQQIAKDPEFKEVIDSMLRERSKVEIAIQADMLRYTGVTKAMFKEGWFHRMIQRADLLDVLDAQETSSGGNNPLTRKSAAMKGRHGSSAEWVSDPATTLPKVYASLYREIDRGRLIWDLERMWHTPLATELQQINATRVANGDPEMMLGELAASKKMEGYQVRKDFWSSASYGINMKLMAAMEADPTIINVNHQIAKMLDVVLPQEGGMDAKTAQQLRDELNRSRTVFLPKDLARELRFLEGKETTRLDKALAVPAMLGSNLFKKVVLYAPPRFLLYNVKNAWGDADAAMWADPMILAADVPGGIVRQLWDYHHNGRGTPFITELVMQGVISTNLLNDEVPRDRATVDAVANVLKVKAGGTPIITPYMNVATKYTAFRENILRAKAYVRAKQVISQGQQPLWASREWIIYGVNGQGGLSTVEAKAARMSKDLLGDYALPSRAAQLLRKGPFPFFTWKEVNYGRTIRLWENALKRGGVANAAKHTGAKVAVGTIGAVTKLAVGMAAVTAGQALWNHLWMKRDGLDPETLPEQDKAYGYFYIPFSGVNGAPKYQRVQGASMDILEDLGLWDAHSGVRGRVADAYQSVANGEASIGDAAIAIAADAPLGIAKHVSNKLFQMSGPIKMIYEAAYGVQSYPDVWKKQPMRDRADYLWNAVYLKDPMDFIDTFMPEGKGFPEWMRRKGKTVRPAFWTRMLGVKTVPLDEYAYYDVVGWKKEWDEKFGKGVLTVQNKSDKKNEQKRKSLIYWRKKAMTRKEPEALAYIDSELKRLGWSPNSKSWESSIQNMHPLHGFKANYQEKEKFRQYVRETYGPVGDKKVSMAVKYWEEEFGGDTSYRVAW